MRRQVGYAGYAGAADHRDPAGFLDEVVLGDDVVGVYADVEQVGAVDQGDGRQLEGDPARSLDLVDALVEHVGVAAVDGDVVDAAQRHGEGDVVGWLVALVAHGHGDVLAGADGAALRRAGPAHRHRSEERRGGKGGVRTV